MSGLAGIDHSDSLRCLKLATTWTRQAGGSFSQDAANQPVVSLPAPCCCFRPQAGQLSAEFPGRRAGQQVSLGVSLGS